MIGHMTSIVVDPPTSKSTQAAPDGASRPASTVTRGSAWGDGPPIVRPVSLTLPRFLLIVVTTTSMLLSILLGAAVPDESVTDDTLALFALGLGLTALVAGAVFGVWAFGRRTTIDGLRWQSFRRARWGGWWSVVWALTPVVALVGFSLIEARTDSLAQASSVLIALVVVRMMSLDALGANMKRVVLDGRRFVRAGALATALADFLVVVIVWTALVQPDLDRDLLRVPTSILPMSVLLAAVFSLAYTKRVERWVLEWWDNRWGCTEQVALEHFDDVALGGTTARFAGRWLLPTAPLRLLVGASYLALAAATAWSGWTVWTLRDGLADTDSLEASLARLDDVANWFLGALLAMQSCHAAWCIAQAWNARRCTLGAPSVLGTSVLFLLGPAIAAWGVFLVDDPNTGAAIVGLGIIVNLACWALSFSLLGRMLRALGKSTNRISAWGAVVALHWVLLFAVRSIALVDDATLFAGLVLAVSMFDAAIFLKAAVHAHLAMSEVNRATVGYQQVRRRPVRRRRSGRSMSLAHA